MKKTLIAGLFLFAAHYLGHGQGQLPPVKQGSDAPARGELPIKGGGTQNGTHTTSQSATQDTRQVLTHSAAQGLTQGAGQGLTQGAAQGSSQITGPNKNVSPLKTAGGAGAAKPAAPSAADSQTLQKAPLKGGGTTSGTSGATKLPIRTSNH